MNPGKGSRGFTVPEVKTFLLGNGLKVHAVPKPELPLLEIHFVFPFGAEADPAGKGGLADFMAEMLTLGTQKRPAAQLAADVDALGAALSAYSGWDSTALHIAGLSEDWERLMELLLEIYTQPAFAGQEFDQLQKRRMAALVQRKDESRSPRTSAFRKSSSRGLLMITPWMELWILYPIFPVRKPKNSTGGGLPRRDASWLWSVIFRERPAYDGRRRNFLHQRKRLRSRAKIFPRLIRRGPGRYSSTARISRRAKFAWGI